MILISSKVQYIFSPYKLCKDHANQISHLEDPPRGAEYWANFTLYPRLRAEWWVRR